MKKYIVTLLTIFGFCHVASADTDIKNIDNVIYIDPVEVPAGSQQILSIKMKNNVNVQGFGFDLYLPKGMEFVTDDSGDAVVELSTERTTSKKTDTFMYTIQKNGSLRVFGTSLGGYTISGNDGEIALVKIAVPSSYPQGEYTLTLKEVTVTDNYSIGYDTDLVESTITVSAPIDNWITLDETSTIIPDASDGEVDIKVKRTINAGEWSTIVLPFSMTEEQVKAVFGDDVELVEFVSYDINDDATEITVSFENADLSSEGFLSNYPYLIRTSQDIHEFMTTSTIEPDEENAVAEYAEGKGKKRHVCGTFIGTLHAGIVIPENNLFLNGNKFWYSAGKTKMKAFRAYFDFEDVLSAKDGANANISFVFDDTDNIKEIEGERVSEGVYNIAGQHVGEDISNQNVHKGIYIKDGKKIVVK